MKFARILSFAQPVQSVFCDMKQFTFAGCDSRAVFRGGCGVCISVRAQYRDCFPGKLRRQGGREGGNREEEGDTEREGERDVDRGERVGEGEKGERVGEGEKGERVGE